MNSMINASIKVSPTLLAALISLSAGKKGFLSISCDKGVTHLGFPGCGINIFKNQKGVLCDVDLPEPYVVSINLEDLRSYPLDKLANGSDMISLGDAMFMPRLKMRPFSKNKDRAQREEDHVKVVQAIQQN